jgi:hypothetical protein
LLINEQRVELSIPGGSMSFVNRFKLLQTLMARESVDSKDLLSDVDQDKVMKALKASKDGLPKSIRMTFQPMEEKNLAKMQAKDKKKLRKLQLQLRSAPGKALKNLLLLRRKYPNVPAIYNYIGNAYHLLHDEENEFRTVSETIERFPWYLFGKTSLAEYYLEHKEQRKVRELFQGKFEMWQHFPEVETFHVSEVRSFFNVVGTYFARANNISRALFHYIVLREIDPDHLATKRVGNEIVAKEIDNLMRKSSRNKK